ncbi:MAG: 50S ribosomal protein L6, partial [Thermodesulfovibrionales bacterium]
MSRIGKQPVGVPKGVNVAISGQEITVRGPKGQLNWVVPQSISVTMRDEKIIVERQDDAKPRRALHGLSRSMIANMVRGVTEGFRRDLELAGVGYRAQVQGSRVVFSLGYSHPVEFELPEGVTAEVDKKQTQISIMGIDKYVVGQTAANMRE